MKITIEYKINNVFFHNIKDCPCKGLNNITPLHKQVLFVFFIVKLHVFHHFFLTYTNFHTGNRSTTDFNLGIRLEKFQKPQKI